MSDPSEIFLVTFPGYQNLLADEARAAGFTVTSMIAGGVTIRGGWSEVMRANLVLRGAGKVLARVTEFPAAHPAQLDKRARKLAWGDWLRRDVPVTVSASSRKSKIYHLGAIKSRVEGALADAGYRVESGAPVKLMVRIDQDICTLSIDTSGELLHKRGLKQEVNKAPMRETMAALFLRAAGYRGEGAVLDPMCGSGTFVIEAAEIATGLFPGRARSFAFEHLVGFDNAAWQALRDAQPLQATPYRFFGSDRDAGAVRMSLANADRAGVGGITTFSNQSISEITAPDVAPGLVIANPPYGGRIGASKGLYGLYAAFGTAMRERLPGWRVAMITAEPGLAKATGLNWQKPGPVIDHGGIKVRLWQTAAS